MSTRSLVGSIDSVTIKLRTAGSQPGADRLSSPATDRLTVRNYGDTLIRLIANAVTTDEDFAAQLSRTLLEITAEEVIPGERIVETYVYAGGLRSDQARTFVQVPDPNIGDAGADIELVVCEGDQAGLFEALQPRARRGGTWSPNLNFDDLWGPNEQDYGVFRYTVDRDDCPPVAVTRSSTICLGDTLTIEQQAFTTAGNYDLLLPGGSCDTLLRLELLLDTPDTSYIDTALFAGEVLELNGMTYDTAGVFYQEISEPDDCGQVLIIALDFITSNRPIPRLDGFWHPTLLRSGTDALVFHPRNSGTVVIVEQLEVFDLTGRKVSAGNRTWLPTSYLPVGVYVFRAQLRVDGVVVERTGRVVVSK